jgi:hypothetical protein
MASETPRRGGKRGNGEGTIYQRQSDGNWCASVHLTVVTAKCSTERLARKWHASSPPHCAMWR